MPQRLHYLTSCYFFFVLLLLFLCKHFLKGAICSFCLACIWHLLFLIRRNRFYSILNSLSQEESKRTSQNLLKKKTSNDANFSNELLFMKNKYCISIKNKLNTLCKNISLIRIMENKQKLDEHLKYFIFISIMAVFAILVSYEKTEQKVNPFSFIILLLFW